MHTCPYGIYTQSILFSSMTPVISQVFKTYIYKKDTQIDAHAYIHNNTFNNYVTWALYQLS